MIAALNGRVAEKSLGEAVIDVQGVGYRVAFSNLALGRLPPEGEGVQVRVRTVVREDALDLYGFLTRGEEEMFLLLTSVSGVGPKLALNVLSGLEVPELAVALGRGEVSRLTKIHGVGKKTAERLVLELKEKVKELHLEAVASSLGGASAPAPASGAKSDLVSALLNLGYKGPQAEKAADLASERLGPEAPFQQLFREALKSVRSSA
ncbi:Holliday junction branch migration protein RuvA [Aggregicoccus sp. 17bor-14]|uniref:Holliday junction branch migration protein RuvA n=1 Tax=Myxococcaceae TaxID=31 RepID=UPI00129C4119|nr:MULTISPECIES: Holliday junction branch migration protein RuvA [Myxococcaceae]MBF5042568.1 Holliday junction branch migration protein RuvA [Simulacricoccus sp. 17bor-14]MRI88337.1 Holliday junction branch migration protein RuvA [Aggregicoccus sp. 17bor-14]